jgi:hypothetical protein
VELREELAAGKAAQEAHAHASARSSAELTIMRRKLQDASAALAESEARGASLAAQVAALQKEISREQQEVKRLQGVAKVAKEEEIRAKQWREAQTTVNNDKLQEQQDKTARVQQEAHRRASELAMTIERLKVWSLQRNSHFSILVVA